MFEYIIYSVYKPSGNLYDRLLGIHTFTVFRIGYCHCWILTDCNPRSFHQKGAEHEMPAYRYISCAVTFTARMAHGYQTDERSQMVCIPETDNIVKFNHQGDGCSNAYSGNRSQKTYWLLKRCFYVISHGWHVPPKEAFYANTRTVPGAVPKFFCHIPLRVRENAARSGNVLTNSLSNIG